MRPGWLAAAGAGSARRRLCELQGWPVSAAARARGAGGRRRRRATRLATEIRGGTGRPPAAAADTGVCLRVCVRARERERERERAERAERTEEFSRSLVYPFIHWLVLSQLRARLVDELQRMNAAAARAREAATRQAEQALAKHLRARASALALEQQRQGRATVRRATAKALAAADVCVCCECLDVCVVGFSFFNVAFVLTVVSRRENSGTHSLTHSLTH